MNTVTNIRTMETSVFVEVHGRAATKLASKYGVRINLNRYWFTNQNYDLFIKELQANKS